jgi:protein SCO1
MNKVLTASLLALASAVAFAGTALDCPDHPAGSEHAAHQAMLNSPRYAVSSVAYEVPDVVLQNESGASVKMRELLNGERPVAVNFIFTSCTTICPVMTATMLQLQKELAGEPRKPLYVSISIDPEFDSAATLKAYAGKFGADWTFLTGAREDVLTVLRSFAAYRGAKSNHTAITLFRHTGEDNWSRVEGLASAKDLAKVWKDGAG